MQKMAAYSSAWIKKEVRIMEKWAVRFKTPTSEGVFKFCIEDGKIRAFDGKREAERFAKMCKESFGDLGNVYEAVPYPIGADAKSLKVGFKSNEKWNYQICFATDQDDVDRLLDEIRARIMDCEKISITRCDGFRLKGGEADE